MQSHQSIKLLLTLTLFFIGCATPFQPKKGSGLGYSDVRLSQETYTVRFFGNKHTDIEQAQENCYRRAAELAVEHGYKYIIVLDSKNDATEKTITYTITVTFNKDRPETDKIVVDADFYLYKYLRPK